MTKRSQRCPSRGERAQHGCIYGFISMFDFRNGRTTQKLLLDRRREDKPPSGDGDVKYKHGKSTGETSQGAPDNEERSKKKSDSGTPSVKKLLEQAMIDELNIKNVGNAEVESREFYTEHKVHKRKNHKKKNRSHSKSCEKLDVDKISEMEQPSSRKSEKNNTCVQYDRFNKANAKNPDHQEKLVEAIRLLISQKFIDGNHGMEDVNIHSSEELASVLQNLNSNNELLQKLLQRPKPEMVKYIQDLCKAQEENSRESGDVTHKKHCKLFGRKAKSSGKSSSTVKKVNQSSNEIVILTPGPASLHNPGNERLLVSSSESEVVVRNKGPNDKVGSHYFFTEVKRKLKSAMGKELHKVSTDCISNRSPNNHLLRSKSDKIFNESFGRNYPGKDHILVEKIPKHPTTVKKGHKIGKFSDCESSTENEIVDYPKQRATTLYIEAKRHLSQMLSNDSGDEDLQSIHVLKPLGKILSLPEYGSSPIASPQQDWRQRFSTDHVFFSANDEEFKNQGNSLNHATMPNLDGRLPVPDKIADDNAQRPSTSKSKVTDETVDGIHSEEKCNSFGKEVIFEGSVETVESEIESEKEYNSGRILETSTSSNVGDEQNGDMPTRSNEAQSSEQDSCKEQQLLTSPSLSPSIPSNNVKKDEDMEDAELLERPSPVSVLEPLFMEEDVSPASIRSQHVELPLQPLRIQFEEMDHLAMDLSIHFKTCTDDWERDDWESIFQYANALLSTSGMNWDNYYIKLHSLDQLLDPLLFDEVDFFPSQHSFDKKLIFDCINEVLLEVYWRYFGGASGLSSVNPSFRPVPALRDAIYEVCMGVHWHLSAPLPHNLDKIVRKDMAKSRTWMDLRYDTEIIATEICELISEDLMGETLLSFTRLSQHSKKDPNSSCRIQKCTAT